MADVPKNKDSMNTGSLDAKHVARKIMCMTCGKVAENENVLVLTASRISEPDSKGTYKPAEFVREHLHRNIMTFCSYECVLEYKMKLDADKTRGNANINVDHAMKDKGMAMDDEQSELTLRPTEPYASSKKDNEDKAEKKRGTDDRDGDVRMKDGGVVKTKNKSVRIQNIRGSADAEKVGEAGIAAVAERKDKDDAPPTAADRSGKRFVFPARLEVRVDTGESETTMIERAREAPRPLSPRVSLQQRNQKRKSQDRNHSGPRLVCGQCNKAFKTSDALNTHKEKSKTCWALGISKKRKAEGKLSVRSPRERNYPSQPLSPDERKEELFPSTYEVFAIPKPRKLGF